MEGFPGLELHCELQAITAALEEQINMLDPGGDTDVRRPQVLEELLAQMKELLNRMDSQQENNLLIVRDLVLDIEGRIVKRNELPIRLTKREFEIIRVLMKNSGRVMTREMLLEAVWGYDSEVDIKVVDVYISYLRSKIDLAGQPSMIQTMRGLGYVIRK